jgi:hypothetical protein
MISCSIHYCYFEQVLCDLEASVNISSARLNTLTSELKLVSQLVYIMSEFEQLASWLTITQMAWPATPQVDQTSKRWWLPHRAVMLAFPIFSTSRIRPAAFLWDASVPAAAAHHGTIPLRVAYSVIRISSVIRATRYLPARAAAPPAMEAAAMCVDEQRKQLPSALLESVTIGGVAFRPSPSLAARPTGLTHRTAASRPPLLSLRAVATGNGYFAECQKHSAKLQKHSVKPLPSVALGKGHTEEKMSAKGTSYISSILP